MKKFLALTLTLALVLALCACGGSTQSSSAAPANNTPANSSSAAAAPSDSGSPAAEPAVETVTLKLGHNSNTDSMYHKGCEKFAELVDEYSGGSVKIEIHNSGTLGNETEMLEGVRMGTVDMALMNASELASYASEFSVLSMPFLFADYDHVEAVNNNAEIRGILEKDAMDNANVQLLFPFWADGFRHIVNSKHEIVHPGDTVGLKIRTPAYEGLIAAIEEFGGAPVSMPFGEAYSAVSAGTVDGMEGNPWTILSNGLYEICDYLTLDGHVYTSAVLIINVDKFNNVLSADQAAAVTKAAEDAGVWETKQVRDSEDSDLEELRNLGMTVTEVDSAEWAEAAQPVYEKFADKYDQDLINKIMALR